MFCKNCGAQIDDDSTFCKECGYSFSNQSNVNIDDKNVIKNSKKVDGNLKLEQSMQVNSNENSSQTITNNNPIKKKSKKIAAILALLLGSLGIHNFYLGELLSGILHIIFIFISTGGSMIAGFIGFIRLLIMSEDKFNKEYNTSEKTGLGKGLLREIILLIIGIIIFSLFSPKSDTNDTQTTDTNNTTVVQEESVDTDNNNDAINEKADATNQEENNQTGKLEKSNISKADIAKNANTKFDYKNCMRYSSDYEGDYVVLDMLLGSAVGNSNNKAFNAYIVVPDDGYKEGVSWDWKQCFIIEDERLDNKRRWLESDYIRVYGVFAGVDDKKYVSTNEYTEKTGELSIPVIKVLYDELIEISDIVTGVQVIGNDIPSVQNSTDTLENLDYDLLLSLSGLYEGIDLMPYTTLSINMYSSADDGNVVGNYVMSVPNTGDEYTGNVVVYDSNVFQLYGDDGSVTYFEVINDAFGSIELEYVDVENQLSCYFKMVEAYVS